MPIEIYTQHSYPASSAYGSDPQVLAFLARFPSQPAVTSMPALSAKGVTDGTTYDPVLQQELQKLRSIKTPPAPSSRSGGS